MAVITTSTTSQISGSSRHSGGTPDGLLYVQAPGLLRPDVADRLAELGLHVTVAADAVEALRFLSSNRCCCCVLDLGYDRAAITAIRLVRARHTALPLIGLFDPAHPAIAAEAVQMGLSEVLAWPFQPADVALILSDVRDRAADPTAGHGAPGGSAGVVSQSKAMRTVVEALRAAMTTHQGVALVGERGSGRKDALRQARNGEAVAPGHVVVVDGAHPPPSGLERLLFGTVGDRLDVGTSSVTERVTTDSALWDARGGTLALAHVPEVPARVQARLARVLRDREVIDAAGQTMALRVCLVAILEADPDVAVQDGRLRRDLADRLSVHLEVPPLRHRREDIPLLAVQLLRGACVRSGTVPKVFSRAALALVSALPWPGNVDDLVALAGSLASTVKGAVVQMEDVLAHARLDDLSTRIGTGGTLREARQRFERDWISAMLVRHHGRVAEAARALGIQRTNLYRKLRQLNVEKALLSARRG